MSVDIHLFKTRRSTWKARIRFTRSGRQVTLYTSEYAQRSFVWEELDAKLAMENIR